MSLKVDTYSSNYIEDLRTYRNEVFTNSIGSYRQKSIGGFVYALASASWRAEEGGIARLTEKGVSYKGISMHSRHPTTLRITNKFGKLFEQVTFRMSLAEPEDMAVYRNIITSDSLGQQCLVELTRPLDLIHGLSVPTEDDNTLLYTEMFRGATGVSPVYLDIER